MKNSPFCLFMLMKKWKQFVLICAMFGVPLFTGVFPATASLSMGYLVTDGYFSPASGSGNESLAGSFIIKPGGITGILPDGSILYPNPAVYSYDSLNLQSVNRNIAMVSGSVVGTLMQVPALMSSLGPVIPDFGYNDQSILTMSTTILDLTMLEHGFDQGREYWRYSERMLVPVDRGNPSSNRLSYDGSGNYYPSSIHFTYELRDNIGKVIQAVYPPGTIGPTYTGVTESTISIGTLVFDATPVPVPSAVWLLGGGLIGLAGWKRRLL